LTEAIKKTVPTAAIRIFFIIIVSSFVSGLSPVMVLSLPRLSLPKACSVKTGWAWEMHHFQCRFHANILMTDLSSGGGDLTGANS
jgi:hypothetical protein